MFDKTLAAYIIADVAFALCGGLLLTVSVLTKSNLESPRTIDNVAEMILLGHCPLDAAITNAALIFLTFALSLPGLIFRENRGWLKTHCWFVVACALFTLALGLSIWFHTLQTRAMLGRMWDDQSPDMQSLLQVRFNCCGYLNSTSPPFQTDTACPTALVAAQKSGCVSPFASFANSYLDLIFTAVFGVVGVDVLLVLCAAMVLKVRKVRARYRLIDAKNNGFGPI